MDGRSHRYQDFSLWSLRASLPSIDQVKSLTWAPRTDCHSIRNEWGYSIYPMCPGHEIIGTVVRVGKNVTNFKVGDRAGVGPQSDSCKTCDACECPKLFFGGPISNAKSLRSRQGILICRKRLSRGPLPKLNSSVQRFPVDLWNAIARW